MICENLIITTGVIGVKERVIENGIVVPSDDKTRPYVAMENLLEDADPLREKGMKSWEDVQEYTIKKEAEAFLGAISYVHGKGK